MGQAQGGLPEHKQVGSRWFAAAAPAGSHLYSGTGRSHGLACRRALFSFCSIFQWPRLSQTECSVSQRSRVRDVAGCRYACLADQDIPKGKRNGNSTADNSCPALLGFAYGRPSAEHASPAQLIALIKSRTAAGPVSTSKRQEPRGPASCTPQAPSRDILGASPGMNTSTSFIVVEPDASPAEVCDPPCCWVSVGPPPGCGLSNRAN